MTRQVYVDNVLPHAHVTIYQNNGQVGTAIAPSPGGLWVNVTPASLTVGDSITATQTYPASAPAIAGVTAGVASGHSNAIIVLTLPDPLPSPVFNGWTTTCTNALLMSGLAPGCTLEVKDSTAMPSATLISQQVGQPTEWFGLPGAPALAHGAVLTAQLHAGGHPAGPITHSLPIALPGPLTLPELSDPPLMGCDTAIGFTNMTPGADLRIVNGSNTARGDSPWSAFILIDLPPLIAGHNALTVQQFFTRCKHQRPGPSATFTVEPPTIGPPELKYVPCTNVRQLTVTNLRAGELLTISRVVQGHAPTIVGVQGVSGATATVNLPASFQATDPHGPVSLELSATLCGVHSATTTVPFPSSSGGPYPPPTLHAPLYDCARAVQVLGVHPGSLIQVMSNPPPTFTSTIARSNPVVAVTADPVVPLWTPLVTDEEVFVTVHGCNAQGPSAKVKVRAIKSPLRPPHIDTPVFAGAPEVDLTGVDQGAQVYLFINGEFRSEVDTNALATFDSTVSMPVGTPPLAVGDTLIAQQTLCTEISQTKQGGPGSAVATQLFVRRSVWGLEASETFDPTTLAYAQAIRVMQARSPSDPTSWSYQAAMHATYATPAMADWNGCQHGNWFFLPWHRMYLYFFERIVRAAVTAAGGPADFALPYWNYNLPSPGNTIPPAWRAPTLPDSTPNPLYLAPPLRASSYMAGAAFDPSVTSPAVALADTVFATTTGANSFGSGKVGPVHFASSYGDLEQTPHNVMHVVIGGSTGATPCSQGLMTDPNCSAQDPIFFLHHANIDRLWNTWIDSGGGRVDPPDASWNDASFSFFDEHGASVSMTPADVLDTATQLSYIYDDQPSPLMKRLRAAKTVAPGPAPEPSKPAELVAATERPLTLRGTPVTVPLRVPDKARALVEACVPGSTQVLVSVDDITAKANPGIAYGVYLDLPRDADVDLRRSYHVGNIGLFGIESMNDPDREHDCAPGFPLRFDATAVVALLHKEGRWLSSGVTVTIQPIEPLPPPGQEGTWRPEPIDESTVPPVEIGRVGLFIG